MRNDVSGFTRLLQIAGRKKRLLLFAMLLSVLSAVMQVVPYVSVYAIICELAGKAAAPQTLDYAYVWKWGLISLVSVVGYAGFLYVSGVFSHIAAYGLLYDMRVSILQKMVRLPIGFFSQHASGELKKIMVEDIERIELFIAHHISETTSSLVFPLIVMGWLFTADWRLACIVLSIFLAAGILQACMVRGYGRQAAAVAGFHDALGRMNAAIVEYVRGMQVIKIFSRSGIVLGILRQHVTRYGEAAIAMCNSYANSYTGFLVLLSSPLLFLVPTSVFFLVGSSYISYLPTVFLFYFLGTALFFPVFRFMYMNSLLAQNSAGVEKVDDILRLPELPEPVRPRFPITYAVRFDHVSFAYGTKQALDDISFQMEEGGVTALVGRSGAGKSTAAMLVARFWDVQAGSISIGGVDVRDIPFERLMGMVSFVFQDTFLFCDTVAENIRRGNGEASSEQIQAAAKAAHCHEFIERLPQGYDTVVGEGGTYLSGGEQQRVALARAILKDAPIVLLDEATAFADPENEGKILESLAHLCRDKTTLVIAHRLSTIVDADQIVVFDNGRIAGMGSHRHLLSQGGVYCALWDASQRSQQWKFTGQKHVSRRGAAGGTGGAR